MKAQKVILWVALIVVLSLLLLANLGFKITGNNSPAIGGNGNYANMPEKCRPTQGYTEQSWKEHLGHHSETQDCLKYFK